MTISTLHLVKYLIRLDSFILYIDSVNQTFILIIHLSFEQTNHMNKYTFIQ